MGLGWASSCICDSGFLEQNFRRVADERLEAPCFEGLIFSGEPAVELHGGESSLNFGLIDGMFFWCDFDHVTPTKRGADVENDRLNHQVTWQFLVDSSIGNLRTQHLEPQQNGSLLNMSRYFRYPRSVWGIDTPPKTNMEHENHPFERENHLPNLHVWVPC